MVPKTHVCSIGRWLVCVVLSRQAEGREKKEGKKKAHCSKVSSYVEAVPIHMRASQCFLMHSSIFLFFSLVLICLFVYFTRGAVAVVVHFSEFIAASPPSLCLISPLRAFYGSLFLVFFKLIVWLRFPAQFVFLRLLLLCALCIIRLHAQGESRGKRLVVASKKRTCCVFKFFFFLYYWKQLLLFHHGKSRTYWTPHRGSP